MGATAEQVDAIGYVGGALLAGCFLPQVKLDLIAHPAYLWLACPQITAYLH